MRAVMFVFLNVLQLLYTSSSPLQQTKCFASDSKCLTARAQESLPIFVQGLLDIPTERLDPMCIDYIFKEKEGLIFEGRNLVLEGLRNSIIDEVSIDMTSKVMRLVFHIEDLLLRGYYKNDGLLFTLPICGEGDFVVTQKNTQMAMIMPFDILLDSYGRNYMNMKSYTYDFDVKGGAKYWFNNLYYGDQAKSDFTHNYMNTNWKVISQAFSSIVLDDATFKIFNAVATFMRSRPIQDLLL